MSKVRTILNICLCNHNGPTVFVTSSQCVTSTATYISVHVLIHGFDLLLNRTNTSSSAQQTTGITLCCPLQTGHPFKTKLQSNLGSKTKFTSFSVCAHFNQPCTRWLLEQIINKTFDIFCEMSEVFTLSCQFSGDFLEDHSMLNVKQMSDPERWWTAGSTGFCSALGPAAFIISSSSVVGMAVFLIGPLTASILLFYVYPPSQ